MPAAAKKRPRVLAVAGYDSFLRAAARVAEHFARAEAEIEFALLSTRRDQITEAQVAAENIGYPMNRHTMESLFVSGALASFDIVLLALEGVSSRKFFLRLDASEGPRPVVVAFYPGIVLRYPFDGLSSRAPADFLWLNGESDLHSYRLMCQSFGVDSTNARLFGGAQLLADVVNKPQSKRVVFFEQTVIPRAVEDRTYLAEQLVDLARRWPDHTIVIKPRHRASEHTLHRTRAHIAPLIKMAAIKSGGMPANLSISYESARELLKGAEACITVSSTVALEAINADIPTVIISDFGAHDDNGVHYFFGSGLLSSFAQINLGNLPHCSPRWREEFICDPHTRIAELVAEVISAAGRRGIGDGYFNDRTSLYFSKERHEELKKGFNTDEIAGRSYQDRKPRRFPKLFRAAVSKAFRALAR